MAVATFVSQSCALNGSDDGGVVAADDVPAVAEMSLSSGSGNEEDDVGEIMASLTTFCLSKRRQMCSQCAKQKLCNYPEQLVYRRDPLEPVSKSTVDSRNTKCFLVAIEQINCFPVANDVPTVFLSVFQTLSGVPRHPCRNDAGRCTLVGSGWVLASPVEVLGCATWVTREGETHIFKIRNGIQKRD
jgi:hypothetical protein